MSLGKGLGRGFESLIPTDLVDEEFDLTAKEDKTSSELKHLKISEIVPDDEQPRREFDEEAINALATSIKEHGVLQPIVVTREDGKYKIVAGERRWRASKIAGKKTIPAIVRSLDSQNRLELSIIENAQREDLNPIELATAYAKLAAQFNLSTKDIGAKVGKSEASVIATMRLLNLPDEAKHIMVKEKLTEGVMRPLVNADEKTIKKLLPKIVEEGWTSRRVERYFQDHRKKSSAALVKLTKFHKDEDALSAKYDCKTAIAVKSITFKFKTEKEMRAVLDKLMAN